jgi:3-dehydroquinate dehydratase II
MKKEILVLNGVNLNMLGIRQPDTYGNTSLKDIQKQIQKNHNSWAIIDFFQSNSEDTFIKKIHKSKADFIIINPAAWTHTSIAIMDALLSVDIPYIELHISNIYKREEYRQKSFFSANAMAVICGLGVNGYNVAMYALKDL